MARLQLSAFALVGAGMLVAIGTQYFSQSGSDNARLAQEEGLNAVRHTTARVDGSPRGEPVSFPKKNGLLTHAAFEQTKICDLGAAKVVDGKTRLALLVGVGKYKSDQVDDLDAPPKDVEKIYKLLTEENGYGFPKENVCILLDEDATRSAFVESFREGLVNRAVDGASIVVFFAGHGSQQPDTDQDETDNQDETWLFHDTGTPVNGKMSGALVDDELNVLMNELRGAASNMNIAVILDSCNSGSATRGISDNITARYQNSAALFGGDFPEPEIIGAGDGEQNWFDNRDDGASAVVLAAAGDGQLAWEFGEGGHFTSAIYTALSKASAGALSYRDIEPVVRANVQGIGLQVPRFYGTDRGLDADVFGSIRERKPLTWQVTEVASQNITLGEGPLPGAGNGALFRIYDQSTPAASFGDPAFSKAKAEVVGFDVTSAKATPGAVDESNPIEVGDYAVLINVGDTFRQSAFRIRPLEENGGIPSNFQMLLTNAYDNHSLASQLFTLAEELAPMELSRNGNGDFQLTDSNGRVRNIFSGAITDENAKNIVQVMHNHARQSAIRLLSEEESAGASDKFTLKLSLRPNPGILAQVQNGVCREDYKVPSWDAEENGADQIVPVCAAYDVIVERSVVGPDTIQVGGLHLSPNGEMLALPDPNMGIGTSLFLTKENRIATLGIYQAVPPLNIEEAFIVFGTRETNPIDWTRYQTDKTPASRSVQATFSPLAAALDEYVDFKSRSVSLSQPAPMDPAYSVETLNLTIQANTDCRIWGKENCAETEVTRGSRMGSREYTISAFDIRPYLPDDQSSSLRSVLKEADCLSKWSVDDERCPDDFAPSLKDGVSYKQHDWSEERWQDSLKLGIDCSRSIWHVFRQAGLKYNRNDRYLPTADMVTSSTWMNDEFVQCEGDYRTGDVIVYRNDEENVGHVVMVIDPEKRIAWGSHGWDGNIRFDEENEDTGVEYQLIRFKKDWEAWDKAAMQKKACWRHRKFAEEHANGTSLPGLMGAASVCKEGSEEACGIPASGG